MRRAGLLLGASLALSLASRASAEERTSWSVSAGVGNVWLGPAERPTGGLSIVAGARRVWPVGDRVTLDAALSIESFGFAGGSHWMGLIGGPVAGVTWETPVEGLSVGVDASIAYGRMPVCNDWGLCLRFWGLFPGGSLRVVYAGSTVGIVSDLTVRYVDTLAWQGASVGATAGGLVRW